MHRPTARRARRLAGALTLVAAACANTPAGREATVVGVAAQPCDTPNRDLGVGVVVGDGVVLTAAHTVDGPRRSVTIDGAPARVLDVDARTDLALLTADIDGEPAVLATAAPPAARLRTTDGEQPVEIVRTGDLIVNDTTAGLRHRRQVHTFSPAVTGGTSGAPLLDAEGRIVGIVVLANRGDGTAYAVTAAEIADLLADMGREPARPPCPG
jgi:S1-C subfamily serine protease